MGRQIARRTAKPELSHMNIFCAFLVIFIHCASVIIGETTSLDTLLMLSLYLGDSALLLCLHLFF